MSVCRLGFVRAVMAAGVLAGAAFGFALVRGGKVCSGSEDAGILARDGLGIPAADDCRASRRRCLLRAPRGSML
jgi:hypothetical protein